MADKVPVRKGIFVEGPDGGTLLGCRCRSCGTRFFPKGVLCLRCQEDDLEEIYGHADGRTCRRRLWCSIHAIFWSIWKLNVV